MIDFPKWLESKAYDLSNTFYEALKMAYHEGYQKGKQDMLDRAKAIVEITKQEEEYYGQNIGES